MSNLRSDCLQHSIPQNQCEITPINEVGKKTEYCSTKNVEGIEFNFLEQGTLLKEYEEESQIETPSISPLQSGHNQKYIDQIKLAVKSLTEANKKSHKKISERLRLAEPQYDFAHYFEYELLYKCLASLGITISVGILVFGKFSFLEQNTTIDALYLCAVTFTTIGYGDIYPSDDTDRALFIIFGFFGVLFVGLSLVLGGNRMYKAHQKALRTYRSNLAMQFIKLIRQEAKIDDSFRGISIASTLGIVFRVVYARIPVVFFVSFLFSLMGYLEGWDAVTVFYYGSVSATTIGYGDYHPTKQISRLYAVFLCPFSALVLGELFTAIISEILVLESNRAEAELFNRDLTIDDLKVMDSSGDNTVDLLEFVQYMLVVMGKASEDDLEELNLLYENLQEKYGGAFTFADLDEKYENVSMKLDELFDHPFSKMVGLNGF